MVSDSIDTLVQTLSGEKAKKEALDAFVSKVQGAKKQADDIAAIINNQQRPLTQDIAAIHKQLGPLAKNIRVGDVARTGDVRKLEAKYQTDWNTDFSAKPFAADIQDTASVNQLIEVRWEIGLCAPPLCRGFLGQ